MRPRSRPAIVLAILCGLLALASGAPARAVETDKLVVFAAASLKTALDEIAVAWSAETGATAVISPAGSAQLARQIQHGAPADVFVSANPDWMDLLEHDRLIEPATRRNLLRNRLVLIAHGRTAAPVAIEPGFDLANLLADGKLAMALVEAVPAGIYGKAALTSLGIWEAVAPKVAQADNVRAALALVARGEAPYGIVYTTDAAASDNVTVVATFPTEMHPPIIYTAAVTAESGRKDRARAFLDYLSSEAAAPVLVRHGFAVIERGRTD